MADWLGIDPEEGVAPFDGQPARFLLRTGEEVVGVLEPYWCGSDCPCGLEAGGMFGDETPQCWWIAETEQIPTHWRPL